MWGHWTSCLTQRSVCITDTYFPRFNDMKIAAPWREKMTPPQSQCHLFLPSAHTDSLLINRRKLCVGLCGWEALRGALIPWAWPWVSVALVSWLQLQWTPLLQGAQSQRWQWGPRGPHTLILKEKGIHTCPDVGYSTLLSSTAAQRKRQSNTSADNISILCKHWGLRSTLNVNQMFFFMLTFIQSRYHRDAKARLPSTAPKISKCACTKKDCLQYDSNVWKLNKIH